MSRFKTTWAGSLLAVALLPGSAYGSTHGVQAEPKLQVIATGLDNPRAVEVHGGAVYVAESGNAGDECVGPADARQCFGLTGAITRISHGRQQRIFTGLPSGGVVDGDTNGPTDVAFDASGRVFSTIGLAPEIISLEDQVSFGDRFATLERLWPAPARVADLEAYEIAHNADSGDPTGTGTESNPFSLVIERNGTKIVVDAAGNDLVKVSPSGGISTVAVFPSRCVSPPGTPPVISDPGTSAPCPAGLIRQQAVPTGVVRGPDGAFYVSELSGFPFTVGSARIWRVTSSGQKSVVADGLTNVIDLAFDPHGRLYALEHDNDSLLAPGIEGALIRVGFHGQQNTTVLNQGLPKATGLAIGPDGAAYIAIQGVPEPPAVPPSAGEVVRVSL